MNTEDNLFVKPYHCLSTYEKINRIDYDSNIPFDVERIFVTINTGLIKGYTYYVVIQNGETKYIYSDFVDFNRKV